MKKDVVCINNSNTCREGSFANFLLERGRKHKEEIATANEVVNNLYKVLSPQIDAIMLSDEYSRIRNQEYLDRLAYSEAACSRANYDFDFDNYDDSQRFFERQHKL